MQQHPRLLAPERYETNLVASLVGVGEEREHSALDGGHAVSGGHRAARVDDEEYQVPLPPLAQILAQVFAAQYEARRYPAPLLLMWSRCTERRRKRYVVSRRFGFAVAHRVSVNARDPATSAQGSAASFLWDFQTNGIELPGRGEVPLTRAGFPIIGLPGRISYRGSGVILSPVFWRTVAARRVRVGVFVLGEGGQLFGVYAGVVEGVAPAAVREGEQGSPAHVVGLYRAAGLPGGDGTGGLGGDEISPQAIHSELRAEDGYFVQRIVGEVRGGEPLAGFFHPSGELTIGFGPFVGELGGVRFIVQPAAYDLHPLGGVGGAGDFDRDPEPVE